MVTMNITLRYLPYLLLIPAFKPRVPSGLEILEEHIFKPKIPAHCQHQTLCADAANYPHEYIDDLLRRNSTIFNAISLLGGLGTPEGCLTGQDPDDIELCPSEIKLLQPHAGRDSSGEWYFLVSKPWLCVEICKNPGEPCSSIVSIPTTGYAATCEQKHIKKRSIALDRNGAVKYITLEIQSACCCHVRQNTGITLF